MKFILILASVALAAVFTAAPTEAVHGVDVSSVVYTSNWQCLKSNGFSFGVIRCYESVGRPDSNCPHTIYNAWGGKMSHVDIYMFPDPSAGNPAGQVDSMLNYLAGFNIHSGGSPPGTYGMVWLDIEGTQYWHSSQSENRDFFSGLLNQLVAKGQHVGVYTSRSQWEPIMGDWSGGASHPLWYAHYDGSASFSDFSSFGGWSHPSIKQYRGDASLCGAGIDENYYPDGSTRGLNATLSAQEEEEAYMAIFRQAQKASAERLQWMAAEEKRRHKEGRRLRVRDGKNKA